MKQAMLWSAVTAAGLLLTVTGCNKSSTASTPGGGKLTLTVPNSVTVKKGQEAPVEVKIKREGFDDTVAVKFENLPPGVSIKEKPTEFKKGDSDITFHLTAEAGDKTKTQKDHEVKVMASGGGAETTQTFKLNVED